MIPFLKRYWLELIVFGTVFGVLLNCLAPDVTWMNTDSDGAHYVLAAKFMQTAHNTSAPLYLLLGRLFLFIPYGADAWRMGLISVLATTGGTVLVYLIVRKLLVSNPKARVYALIASVVYGGSALVISQSTMVETYPLVTTLSLLAYYFSLERKWIAVAITIGLIWATHTLFAWMIWAVLLIMHKELRNMVLVLITLSFLSFYAYIPIVTAINGDPEMWGNTTFGGFIRGNFSVLLMLAGALSIYDMPKRILDTISMLGVSLGFGLVIIIYYLKRMKKWKYGLMWLFLLPIIWFATNLSSQTYVYMLPSIAFGAILVGLGLSKLHMSWSVVTCVIAVALMGFNAYYFDVGRNLDPEMSAVKFYQEELPKIPDGEIFMGGGWTWAMVYLYNKEENRSIIPVSIDALVTEEYMGLLDNQGIKYERSNNPNHITKQGEIALSVARLNDGVWIAKETNPEVYQYVIEPAKGNEAYIGRWIGQELEVEWRWKPSNPYKFISGELEVAEWHHILRSTHNALFVISLIIYGYFMVWIIMRMRKRRRDEVSSEKFTDALPKS